MIYLGGKSKIAKYILPIILKDRKPGQWYVEPFCGGCNVIKHVDGPRIAADIHPELIALLKALQRGWKPPFIHEELHKQLKLNKNADPALRGYVGFVMSFGGDFFAPFARNWREDKQGNYAIVEKTNERSSSSVMATGKLLKDCKIVESHYDQLKLPPKSLIYCDPPYKGTTGYKTIPFRHENFYHWCRQMKKAGHQIFISELQMPKDFKEVWAMEYKHQVNNQIKKAPRIEKLFTL